MPSLKGLRNRKASVISTKKITSAMKMIAAAKMRKAQDQVEQSKVYADHMSNMLTDLAAKGRTFEIPPRLLVGTGRHDRHLVIVMTSDRGLCGGFNSNISRLVTRTLSGFKQHNHHFEVICVGRRGRDILRAGQFRDQIIETFPAFDKPKFWQANRIARIVVDRFEKGEFDICTIIYNRFISVISQKITEHQLIPYTPLLLEEKQVAHESHGLQAVYDYDPSEKDVLEHLLPQNLAVQIYRALLENAASEHGARMTAMDSATRNANDMIDNLSLLYNRTRQAIVTKELIEIISGAGAL
jgi:F-type H+-transporting ATPase subunit gamma